MSRQNIMKESEKLSHHSLESYICELTQDPSVFEYSQILAHPQIKTINQDYVEMIRLFSFGTCGTLKKDYKGSKLNEKQIDQLKKLTILSQFQGQQSMRIPLLAERIDEPKNKVYKILVQMNTKGLVNVKIDEKKGLCQILWAKHREIEDKKESQNVSEAKLDLIYKKNWGLITELKSVEPKKKPKKTSWSDY